MWPFSVFRRREYERFYNAALVVLLGAYLPARLDSRLQARIEEDMEENFRNSVEPPAAWRKLLAWDGLAACRAEAMARLGIGPGIGGLDWPSLFARWKWAGPRRPFTASFDDLMFAPGKFDARAGWVLMDFHPFHAATTDAKKFLREHGLDVPDIDPYGMGNLGGWDSVLDGTGLREHWQKKERG